MNYEYIRYHKMPIVLEKETGFYARVDQLNSSISNAARSKNDFESETDKEAHMRIKEWIRENHPELLL